MKLKMDVSGTFQWSHNEWRTKPLCELVSFFIQHRFVNIDKDLIFRGLAYFNYGYILAFGFKWFIYWYLPSLLSKNFENRMNDLLPVGAYWKTWIYPLIYIPKRGSLMLQVMLTVLLSFVISLLYNQFQWYPFDTLPVFVGVTSYCRRGNVNMNDIVKSTDIK